MKKNIYSLVLLVVCLLYGCTSHKRAPLSQVIKVDMGALQEEFDISPIMEEQIEVIALQTTDQSFIGKISDIHITQDKIFVTDEMSNKICVFDRQGKYLSQINRIGRGPGEYLRIVASEVVNDSTVVVYDNLSQKLYYYQPDGTFVNSKDASRWWAMNLAEVGGSLYLINNHSQTGSGDYCLFKLSGDGEAECLLPFDNDFDEQQTGWSLDRYYSKNFDELMLYFPPEDYLFIVSDDQIKETYFVDFGDRKLPRSVYMGDATNALMTAQNENYISGVRRAFLSNDCIVLNFDDSELDYHAIFNRKTKECAVCNYLVNRRYPGLLIDNLTLTENGLLIKWMPASDFKLNFTISEAYYEKTSFDTRFERDMVALRDSLDKNDNPVIFIQKFKD